MKISNKEYRSLPGISRSDLFRIAKSPLHFKYETEHKDEPTPSLIFGQAAHKYILEKEEFDKEFVVAPCVDRRTKAGKEQYESFVQNAGNRTVISQSDFETIKEMSAAIGSYPLARQLLTGTVEESFFWTDAETGEECKVRPDCITEYEGKQYLVDYKTTDSCADGHFERSCFKYGYDVQAGMYTEGYLQSEFIPAGFIFVAQEKIAPYAVRIYVCSDEWIAQGYDRFRELLGTYHWCKVNDNWFGYEGANNLVSTLEGSEE